MDRERKEQAKIDRIIAKQEAEEEEVYEHEMKEYELERSAQESSSFKRKSRNSLRAEGVPVSQVKKRPVKKK